jgi:hypothetical protein
MKLQNAYLKKKSTVYRRNSGEQRFLFLSNIAERAADRATQQFSNFSSNAIGSLNEIDTPLDLARRLDYLTQHDYGRLHQ